MREIEGMGHEVDEFREYAMLFDMQEGKDERCAGASRCVQMVGSRDDSS